MISKSLCLCSGGLDSSLVLLKLLESNLEVTPFYVDYNHWSTEGELSTLKDFISWIRQHKLSRSHLVNGSLADLVIVKADLGLRIGGVWGRSIALVGLASMWAFTHGNDYSYIAMGSHKGDICPDCRPGLFDMELDAVLKEATESKLSLFLPIRNYSIEEIGVELLGGKYEVPYELAYSCYWYPPCGYKSKNETYRCPGCRRKVIAMKAASIEDPAKLDLPNCKERSYYPGSAERTVY